MQVIDISTIQAQNERVRLAQRLYAPGATPTEIRLANRAVNQLLQDYQPTIRYFQRQFSGLDPTAAYSAILDAFNYAIRTYQAGVAQFKTWFATKVRYKLLDVCREKKREFVDIDVLLFNGFEIFTQAPAPESPELERLREAICALPDETQRIIGLYTQGYAWAEVGESIGKEAGAARMVYNRAVQKLRKQFIPERPIKTEAAQEIPAAPTPLHWMAALKLRGCRVRFAALGADRSKVVSMGRTHDAYISKTASISSKRLAKKTNAHECSCLSGDRWDVGLSCLIGGAVHAALICVGDLCLTNRGQILVQNT